MKNIVKITMVLATISVSMMSCQKEYNCVCSQQNYNEIVQADSKADADKTCDTKGLDCNIE